MASNIFKGIILFALIAFPLHSYGQVTIGAEEDPVKGALLQLKNIKGVTDGSPNANKGLGAPRVNLTTLRELTDVGTALDKTEHTGLLVYNVNEDICADPDPIYPGLYVWNGNRWEYLGEDPSRSPEVKSFVDQRDGNSYLYREFFDIDEDGNKISVGEWMLENLAYVPAPSEATHGFAEHDGESLEMTKHYMYPIPTTEEAIEYDPEQNPSPEWNKKQGILYNWFAATQTSGSVVESEGGQQGICPPGWHLPTDVEWNNLEKALYNARREYSYFTNEPFYTDRWNPIWDLRGSALEDTLAIHTELSDFDRSIAYRRGDGRSQADVDKPYGVGAVMLNYCEVNMKSYSALKGGFDALLVGVGAINVNDLMAYSNYYGYYTHFWTSSSIANERGIASVYRRLHSFEHMWAGLENAPYVNVFYSVYGSIGNEDNSLSLYNSIRCKKD